MFCPKCAAQNVDDARFCRLCGTDISLVTQAIAGHLPARLDDEDPRRYRRRRRPRRMEREPASIERAFKGLFKGLAFIFIAFAVKTWVPGSGHWWFWMLLPAVGMLSSGISASLRLVEERRRLARPSYPDSQPAVSPAKGADALPPSRVTGEIIQPPPSVTEGTTRHLGVPADRTRRDA